MLNFTTYRKIFKIEQKVALFQSFAKLLYKPSSRVDFVKPPLKFALAD